MSGWTKHGHPDCSCCGYSGPPPPPTIPLCACDIAPEVLTLSIDLACRTANPGCTFATVQPGTFTYQLTPAGMSGADGQSPTSMAHWDTTVRYNASLDRYYMQRIGCVDQFVYVHVVYLAGEFGPAFYGGEDHRWIFGLPGNSCAPFLFTWGGCGGCPSCSCAVLSG